THLLFCGVYEGSAAIPDSLPLPPDTPSATFPPAHITHGYLVPDAKMIHVGLCSVVDDLGAVPLVSHTLSGNGNGDTAIAEQCHLLQLYPPQLLAQPLLLVSDRGTYSAGHCARLFHAGHHVLCSVPWSEFRNLFQENRASLHWFPASFLSVEQQRRRQDQSSLPREYHELAVLRHHVTDPNNGDSIPCRVIFVFSSADQKVCQQKRARAVAKISAGLERIAQRVADGHCRYLDPVLRLLLRRTGCLGRRPQRRLFRLADNCSPHPECRHLVHTLQTAVLCGTGSSPVENAPGR